jgi:hypothetical protein
LGRHGELFAFHADRLGPTRSTKGEFMFDATAHSRSNPDTLSCSDVAVFCEDFIAAVDEYFEWDEMIRPPHRKAMLGGILMGDSESPEVYELRRTKAAVWVRDNGPKLAAALTRHDFKPPSVSVLRIVLLIDDPDAVPSDFHQEWKQIKAPLQQAAIEMRNNKPPADSGLPVQQKGEIMVDGFRQRIPQSFVEIADAARLLYTFYPQNAAEYRRAKSGLKFVRNAIYRGNPEEASNAFPAKGTMLYDALHDYGCRSEHCREEAMTVGNLGHSVATLLPGLWPSLRLVAPGARWHENEEFDWDAAIGELRQIEAAALSAAHNSALTPPTPDQGTGNATPSPAVTQEQGEGNGGAGSAPGKSEDGKPARRKRGRPADTDQKQDKRIYEAWKTGQYKTQADCDRELGLSAGGTYAACERHRKRLERRNKRRRTK